MTTLNYVLVETDQGETVRQPGALFRAVRDDAGYRIELLIGRGEWVDQTALLAPFVLRGEAGAETIDAATADKLAMSYPWPHARTFPAATKVKPKVKAKPSRAQAARLIEASNRGLDVEVAHARDFIQGPDGKFQGSTPGAGKGADSKTKAAPPATTPGQLALADMPPRDEALANAQAGVALADQHTGAETPQAQDLAGTYGEEDAIASQGFQPGTALATSEAVSDYQASFENSTDIYEAAQVLTGMQSPDDADSVLPTGGPNARDYAEAREMLNAMSNDVPSDGDVFSVHAMGSEMDGPTPSFVMTASDEDNLVRGVGDRGDLVSGMRDAMESGETVGWPMASFVWGGNYDDYQGAIGAQTGETTSRTPEAAALDFATKDGYDPVLFSLEGPTEGVFVIDGEFEAVVGGEFSVESIDTIDVPTGNMDPYSNPDDFAFEQTDAFGELVLDANGDPIPLDEPKYIGPTATATQVTLTQVSGPMAVAA